MMRSLFLNTLILVYLVITSVYVYAAEPCNEHCSFVLVDEEGRVIQIVNEERAKTRFTPFSTFKVANTVIALDTGVIPSLDEKLTYDKARYPTEDWWPKKWYQTPLTIRAAFHASAVPIYRELAVKITDQTMQDYLNSFEYGNADISSGLDSFWLNGSIQISAMEQVAFLRALYQGRLPIKQSTLDDFRKVMEVSNKDGVRLFAKTGAGPTSDEAYIGWYVGVVEKAGKQYFFATNYSAATFKEVVKNRITVAKHYLASYGFTL